MIAVMTIGLPLIGLKVLSLIGEAPVRPETVIALPGCPASPNCVSSSDTDETHGIAAISFQGDGVAALAALDAVLVGLGGDRAREAGNYRHYTFRSRWMGFVDDVEVLLDAENSRIEIRSASRSGYGDFGVNRRRVEAIREAFKARDG